ncbi:hypothetical protein [Phormidesmis priestleyi]
MFSNSVLLGLAMQVWLASFFVLFALSELFQWMKHLSLPLPVFILGGAFLAIASNYDRRASFPFNLLNDESSISDASVPEAIAPSPKEQRPISFTIRKPERENV